MQYVHTTIGDEAAKVLSGECLCKQCPRPLHTVDHSVRVEEVGAAQTEGGVAAGLQVGLVHEHQLAVGEWEATAEQFLVEAKHLTKVAKDIVVCVCAYVYACVCVCVHAYTYFL